MSLAQELNERMKTAMKEKDARTLSCIRMLKSKMKEYAIAERISGELSDEQVREIATGYVKQLRKSIPEFEKAGPEAAGRIESIQFEIDYLDPFVPTLLDETQTSAIVTDTIAALGNPPRKKMGMVIGEVMKKHKAEVDPALVRRLVDEMLSE